MAAKKPHKSATKIKHPQRRGIVLLVIISILVLFMLMLVTFAVVSSHYRQAAQSNAARNYFQDDPHQEVDQVFEQILTGPAHPYSTTFGGDVIGDFYGNDGVSGQVTYVIENLNTATTTSPFIGLRISSQIVPNVSATTPHPDQASPVNQQLYTSPFGRTFSTIDDYYAGNVITMTTGVCKGLSSRVTHYRPNAVAGVTSVNVQLRMEPFTTDDGFTHVPSVGDLFLINGKPFNGTGLGQPNYVDATNTRRIKSIYSNDDVAQYNSTTGQFVSITPTNPLPSGAPTYPLALMPNLAGYGNIQLAVQALNGGQDEPWDTFDYQNSFLGLVPADAQYNPQALIFPSFLRPDLVNYWRGQTANFMDQTKPLMHPNNLTLARTIIPRPLPGDHPFFTGSNPLNAFDGTYSPAIMDRFFAGEQFYRDNITKAITDQVNDSSGVPNKALPRGFWDVDNDGDGRVDSIWIDPGLPVVHAANGRPYKRLAAIMIRDLDGRINVNAHGNTEFLEHDHRSEFPISGPIAGVNVGGTVKLPRGLGYGPAEINFLNIFLNHDLNNQINPPTNIPVAEALYRAVIQGTIPNTNPPIVMNSNEPGRYGFDGQQYRSHRRPGNAGPDVPAVNPAPNLVAPSNDPLSNIKSQGFPLNYTDITNLNGAGKLGIYASPPDVWGRGAFAIDYAGFPYPFRLGENTEWEDQNINPAEPTSYTEEIADNPYEINLVETNASDSPYTVAELERVLRRYDHDANNLPTRLLDRLDLGGNYSFFTSRQPYDAAGNPTSPMRSASLRASLVTTLSSHVPAPRGAMPKYMRLLSSGLPLPNEKNYSRQAGDSTSPITTSLPPENATILDAAFARIRKEMGYVGNPGTVAAENAKVVEVLNAIMPFELFRGEMFNLNRPFGNGVDDTPQGAPANPNPGYGTVDEPSYPKAGGGFYGEAFADGVDNNGDGNIDEAAELNGAGAAWTQGPFNNTTVPYLANDDPLNNTYNPRPNMVYKDQRQLYARHLYCLMRLVCDPLYSGTYTQNPGGGSPNLTDANAARAQRERLYARRIAQWAINVVDYRDSDAIMTPFEYDINPFDGWICDGNIVTDENQTNAANFPSNPNGKTGNSQGGQREVVWGMEYPEVLITETMAFHDRGVKDTAHDNPPKKRKDATKQFAQLDNDLDQIKIPQGSLFIELKSTRAYANNNPRFPAELNDPSSPQTLKLSKFSPGRTIGGNNITFPVWRMVVTTNPKDPNSTGLPPVQRPSLKTLASQYTDSMSFDPANFDPANIDPATPITQAIAPDRVIWFYAPNNSLPNNMPEYNKIFYGRSNDVYLSPGEHVVIGPRDTTNIGSTSLDPNVLTPSPHVFSLTGRQFQTMGGQPNNGFTPYPPSNYAGLVKTPVTGIVCAADKPTGWTTINTPIGLNISEPLPNPTVGQYYDEPTYNNAFYANLAAPAAGTNIAKDTPFDSSATYGGPLVGNDRNGQALTRTGTELDFRALFLQRLANPLLPWNPDPSDALYGISGTVGAFYDANLPINPYISVDWSSLDLMVFNGEEKTDVAQISDMDGVMQDFDIDDPDNVPGGGNSKKRRFSSRERGDKTQLTVAPTAPLQDFSLWPNRTQDPEEQNPANASDRTNDPDHAYFDLKPSHSLGYLNSGIGMPIAPVGYAQYQGSPPTPFPLVSWNNRPFANPHELLLVPTSSPSRFGWEFNFYNNSTAKFDAISDPTATPYDPGPSPGTDEKNNRGNFPYLLNFLLGGKYRNDGTFSAADPIGSEFYRLFDLVETPSPFVGTERWYYPATTTNGVWGERYRPPFNRLSRFRDPGKVNINTITEPEVWDALVATNPDLSRYAGNNGTPPIPPSDGWVKLVDSRRSFPGYASNTSGDMFQNVPNSPTFFPNPFRPADAFDLMPLPLNFPNNQPSQPQLKLQRPVDATLLRTDPNQVNRPLLDRPHNLIPTAVGQPSDDYRNTDRNAFFKYQPFSKLPNLVSTNSNTFAVWITIGYFEVDQGPIDAGHPDGYRLGQELGLDDGTAKRHRAFYLLDRSIPVAYEPGKINNAERCVLLKRYIE